MAEKRWIAETLFDDLGFRMTYQVERVLYEMQTEHQHLVLFEHPFFGKMLMLDGATQVTSKDEFIYHEMMTHVPIFAHGKAREVLIVGGGDCGIAEEVLKHKSVERLTQVEIDASVVEFSKEHFPEFTKPVFDQQALRPRDRRRHAIRRQDRAALRRHHRGFHRPAGARQGAVQRKILRRLQTLHDEGRRHGDAERRADPASRASSPPASGSFANCSPTAYCYVAAIPTYVGGHMAMGWATDNTKLRQASVKTIADRYKKAGSFATKYWTPEVHVAAFALPRFIADHVTKARGR